MKTKQFIVVEGVDGVGKTKLAEFLAAQFGLCYLYSLQPPLADCRKEVEKRRDMNLRFFYYLAGNISLQKELKDAMAAGPGVVMDRYIYSTFVMHEVLEASTTCVDMEKLPILWPTHTVLLTASSEVRMKRRQQRGDIHQTDVYFEQTSGLLDRAQAALLKRQSWDLVINTDDLTLENIQAQVMSHLTEETHVRHL